MLFDHKIHLAKKTIQFHDTRTRQYVMTPMEEVDGDQLSTDEDHERWKLVVKRRWREERKEKDIIQ